MSSEDNAVNDADSTLGEATYQRLLSDILSARLRGGTPIQQRRLALEYEVSRSPMRHALGRLEGEGMLVRDADGGLVVRTITLRDYLDSLEMRMLIEPEAAARAALHKDEAELQAMQQQLQALFTNPAPDQAEVWAFDDRLHSYIAVQSKNGFMPAFLRELRRYTTVFERQMPVLRAVPGMREHAALLDALTDGKADMARAAMSFHLEIVRSDILRRY